VLPEAPSAPVRSGLKVRGGKAAKGKLQWLFAMLACGAQFTHIGEQAHSWMIRIDRFAVKAMSRCPKDAATQP